MPKRDGLRMRFHDQLKVDESTPGWQDRLTDSVLGRDLVRGTSGKGVGKREGNHVYINAGLSWKQLVKVAAEKRGASISTYIRRAVAAFIAHDLDITLPDVLEDGPRPCAWGRTGAYRTDPPDTGQDYGPWIIGELHE